MPLIVGLLVLAFLLLAGPAQAAHVQCGDVITTDTVLDSDVLDCPGDGLVVAADGVTIDLAGHTIDGQGSGGGITAQPLVDGLTVTGGTVREFADGVIVAEADDLAVLEMTLEHSTGYGVLCESSSDCVLRDTTVRENDSGGLWLLFSSGEVIDSELIANGSAVAVTEGSLRHVAGNLIARNDAGVAGQGLEVVERNRIMDNGTGITFSYADRRASIRANRITGNLLGIQVEGEEADISGNLIAHNRGSGIAVSSDGVAGDRVHVVGNTITHNGGYGFRAGVESCFETVARNVISENGAGGVLVDTQEETVCANQHQIADNRVGRNGGDGIGVRNTFLPLTIERNRADRNADDGIDVDAPLEGGSQVTVARNRADHNGDFGIEAYPGVVDGGGNRARHNGNPVQCLNVSCR